jgi:colanic acid/amylovoran biosynthesis glycosyltransferase
MGSVISGSVKKNSVLAILSPNQNNYSETFIQAHKNIPGVVAKFYYAGSIPTMLEGSGQLVSMGFLSRIIRGLGRALFKSKLSIEEESLMKSLRKKKAKCVLAEYGMTGASVVRVCKMLRLPLITHFHGYDASQYNILEKNRKSYQDLFEYASSIIAVSRVMESKLIDLGCPSEKITYNPYGPDDRFFDVIPSFKDKMFIGIGRFVDKKAPYYTIFAFAEVLKVHEDARLVLAGDGPLLNMAKNLTKYLGIDKNVDFPGVIKPDVFREYLSRSYAFVQHSITAESGDMEGTPVAILEAASSGLPVVSTFHAGIPDVIIHEKTGLLCNEHDVAEMASYMIRLLNDPELAKKMGSASKENIKKNFTLNKHLNTLGEVVEKISKM